MSAFPTLRRLLLGAAFAALLAPASQAEEPLKVGVIAGPYTEILEKAGEIAARQGVEVEVIEFTDWATINEALDAGDIDLNNFQHKPYLENQVAARGYDLVPLQTSIVTPMGIYSGKVTALDQVPDGARIGIPNDPTNGARALFLLSQAGLVTLAEGADVTATVADIVENPKGIEIIELDAAQLPRSLTDLDLGVVTLNYALVSDLDPHSALRLEDNKSYWSLLFAARRDRAEDPRIQAYIAAYRSPEVKDFVLTRFEGTVLPTW